MLSPPPETHTHTHTHTPRSHPSSHPQRAKDWRGGLRTLVCMAEIADLHPSTSLDHFSLSAAVNACARGGEWVRATSLLAPWVGGGTDSVSPSSAKAPQLASSTSGAPSPAELIARVNELDDEELWAAAQATVAHMHEQGVQPDHLCFAAAIRACENAGAWTDADRLYGDMKSRGLDNALEQAGISINGGRH